MSRVAGLKKKLSYDEIVEYIGADDSKLSLPVRMQHIRDSNEFTQMDGLGLQELERLHENHLREQEREFMLTRIAQQNDINLNELQGIFRHFARGPVPAGVDPTFAERQAQAHMEAELASEAAEEARRRNSEAVQEEVRAMLRTPFSETHARYEAAAARSDNPEELAAELAAALRENEARSRGEFAESMREAPASTERLAGTRSSEADAARSPQSSNAPSGRSRSASASGTARTALSASSARRSVSPSRSASRPRTEAKSKAKAKAMAAPTSEAASASAPFTASIATPRTSEKKKKTPQQAAALASAGAKPVKKGGKNTPREQEETMKVDRPAAMNIDVTVPPPGTRAASSRDTPIVVGNEPSRMGSATQRMQAAVAKHQGPSAVFKGPGGT